MIGIFINPLLLQVVQLNYQKSLKTNPVGIQHKTTVTVEFKKPIGRGEIWKINGGQLIVKFI